MTMILDNLQVSQYQYPEKSTIRELVSNAVDSTKEKFQALSILNGEKQESDFYIRRDGAMFKDSNFNPAYFNQKWLGAETQVQIIYEEGSQLERDKVRIIDQGVGLGGKRLEGYFKLGWSSKRNSVSALGKFGIGAKSALSTGVDYYTVKTRYNGMEFIFNVYSHKVDSVIPPIDLSTGTKNESYLMYEGTKDEYKAYWRPTAQPNGTEVTIEVKKHKKQQYIDAVKSQLLYFDNVSLVIHQADGYTHPIPVKANILFENEYLIVSDNNQYSKPHLVINKVNYGYVDFQELELEQKMGNVGIKVAAEDVSVNPSRESVIWNEQTKKTIQTRFKQAAEAATTIVQEQLKTDDFVHWLRMWANLKRGRTGNDTLSKLSGIVDMATLAPTFPLDSTIKASNVRLLFPGMQVQRIQEVHMYKGGKNVRKLERTDLHFIGDFDSVAPIVLTNAKPKPTTLRYLATVYQQGYYLIRYPENLDKVAIADGEDAENWIAAFEFQEILNKQDEYNDTEFKDNTPRTATTMILANRRKRVVALLEKSNFSQRLDKVQVPDDFSWTADDEEEEVKADATLAGPYISAEEKRKLEQRVVAFTPRGLNYVPSAGSPKYVNGKYVDYDPKVDGYVRLYEWQKVEPKLAHVQNLDGEDIYYGTSKDEEAINFAAALTSPGRASFYGQLYSHKEFQDEAFADTWGLKGNNVSNSVYMGHYGPKAKVTLLRVAQDQVKHYKNYKHVNSFFMRVEGKTITMSNALIRWHTARIVGEGLDKLRFLQNYAIFDQDKASKYQKLEQYYNDNYVELRSLLNRGSYFAMDSDAYKQLISFHEKLMQLQLFARQNSDDVDTIASLSKTLFSTEYENAVGLDLDIYDILQELKEYAEPLSVLLNELPILSKQDEGTPIPENLEAEIRSYIASKGL